MVHRFSRLAVVGLIAAAAALYADDPKCNVSARECDQQIRKMLSGRRYYGAIVEERKPHLFVKDVTEGGPAWRSGLREGDRLVAINGKPLTNATTRDFKQHIADARTTGWVMIIVWRRGTYHRVSFRLEPYTKEQMDKIIAGHLATHSTSTAGAH